jgi:conjugative transfer pilus assembly protein TraH
MSVYKRCVMILFVLFLPTLFAMGDVVNEAKNIGSDLEHFFNGLGMTSNVTEAGAYKGQQGGFYTGGSIFARQSVRNLQLLTAELPSYRAGCGGIDLYTGGLSYVNEESIVAMGRNIINNAKGYAFMLALETVTPQISNGLKYFQDLATKVNQSNINSCETAASLVGSAWSKTKVAQSHVCKDIGTKNNLFTDWAAARQGCGAGGRMNDELTEASADPKYRDEVVDNTNIVWNALKKNAFLSGNKELAELLMSLSGTIIYKSDAAGNIRGAVLESLATDKQLLSALLRGGDAKIYRCDTDDQDRCLNPNTDTEIAIPAENSLVSKVTKIIDDMTDKIYNDTALSSAEIAFLQSTSIPVYKLMNVQAAFVHDRSALDVAQYAELIAVDILFQYLIENLHAVKLSTSALQLSEVESIKITRGIERALAELRAEQSNTYKKVQTRLDLINKTQLLERMLAGQLSAKVMNSVEWAGEMH